MGITVSERTVSGLMTQAGIYGLPGALKRRNRLLEQENEVLRRAAAYLSQAQLPGKALPRS